MVKKFYDSTNHSYPLVYIKRFTSGSRVTLNLVLDTSSFFKDIKVNDTVSKDANSYWIYKKENGVFIQYKSIDFGCENHK